MPSTYTLISAITVNSNTTTIDFTSIPSTYTDLQLKLSARSTTGDSYCNVTFNGASGSLVGQYLYGDSSGAPTSGSLTPILYTNVSGATAGTFGISDMYVQNYSSTSTNKIIDITSGMFNATETSGNSMLTQGAQYSNTAAITRITLTHSGTGQFVPYSTAYLYGIKNS